jgi:hypothetical protein
MTSLPPDLSKIPWRCSGYFVIAQLKSKVFVAVAHVIYGVNPHPVGVSAPRLACLRRGRYPRYMSVDNGMGVYLRCGTDKRTAEEDESCAKYSGRAL